MASPVKEFGGIAEKLSRNPLGVIALFIVLVYAIAALIVGKTGLTEAERRPLIYFLVGFPPIVLLAFYRLVADHHTKLYAPRDYHDGDGFFRALTPEEQRQRLEEEVKEVAEQGPAPVSGAALVGSSLHETYLLVETLVLRELESELRKPIMRHVAIGPDRGVDGMFFRDGQPVVVEVKLVRSSHWKLVLDRVLSWADVLRTSTTPEPAFLFVFVVQDLTETERQEALLGISRAISAKGIAAEARVLDLAALTAKYGVAALASNKALQLTGGGAARS